MLTMSTKRLLFTLITKVNTQSRIWGSRSGGNEELHIFLHITSCSPLKVSQRFRVTCYIDLQGRKMRQALLSICFKLVSCLAHSPTLNMKATCSSETSVDFLRITWRYFPHDRTLHKHVIILTRTVPLPCITDRLSQAAHSSTLLNEEASFSEVVTAYSCP
jgi:hypothetical protein